MAAAAPSTTAVDTNVTTATAAKAAAATSAAECDAVGRNSGGSTPPARCRRPVGGPVAAGLTHGWQGPAESASSSGWYTGWVPSPPDGIQQRHGRLVRSQPWRGKRSPWGWLRVIPRIVAGGSHVSLGASVAEDTPHGRPLAPAAPRAARAAPSPCTSRAPGCAGSSGYCVCTFWCGQSRGDPWPRVWLLPDGSARAPAQAPPAASKQSHASSLTATALRARGSGGGARVTS